MDLALLQQLERAVRHSFEAALHMPVQAEAPILEPPLAAPRDLTAIVKLSGELEGRLALRVSIECAKCLAGLFPNTQPETQPETQSEFRPVSQPGPSADSVCDAIGELASMIAGRLAHEADRCARCGCPQIIIGQAPQLEAWGFTKRLAVPFACDVGELHIDLVMSTGATPGQNVMLSEVRS